MGKSSEENEHKEPQHFISKNNKCGVISPCHCVFLESFRRDLHFRILSHLPFCKYDAPITSQVTSLTINSYRRRHSQVSWQPCVKIDKRDKGWNLTRTFVWSVTTLEWTCPRGSSRGYVRGNTRRWTSTVAFGYNFRADTSCNMSKRVRVFHHRLQTPRK